MASRTDFCNVIDVESTCGSEVKTSEIIQIGICTINVNKLSIENSQRLYICPQKSKITSYCTQLTGISFADVENAPLFPCVMELLFEQYELSRRPWVSWGDYDREQFIKMASIYNTRYFFGKSHINLKCEFALLMGLKREIGLVEATKRMGIGFEGTNHDGLDDAINTARIYIEIVRLFRGEN